MPTLEIVNALAFEEFGFLFGFDPFCDGLEPNSLCQVNEGADEQQVVFVVDQIANKRPVNLDHRDIERTQVAEGREAGAKIIQSDPTAKLVERIHEAR